MATIERSIVINASYEDIDKYAIDATTWPSWFEGVDSVEVASGFPEAGGTVAAQYKTSGITFELTMTSREIVHGSHLIIDMEGMISGTQEWRYMAEGNGTRLEVQFDYKMKGGGLGAVADKLVVERMNASNLEKSLSNLKNLVEG